MRNKKYTRKYKIDYGLDEAYKLYKETSNNPINRSDFGKIVKEYNKEIIRGIIEENLDYTMPGRMGSLRIRKNKIRIEIDEDGKVDTSRLRPDWKATNDLWNRDEESKQNKKIVYHLNKHTNGYNCRFLWDKTISNVINQSLYALIMCRDAKRDLNKVLTNPDIEVDYYE